MTGFIANDQRERFADGAANFHRERALEFWCISGEGLAQIAFQFRIARLPKPVAAMNLAQINVTVAEAEHSVPAAPLDGINAPAFLRFFRMTGVEHHAVAGLERA